MAPDAPDDDDPPGAADDVAGGRDPAQIERMARGRARAEHELRIAAVVGIVALLVGQVLLLAGAGPLALVLIAVPGTAAGLALARRWSRMAAGELDP